MVRAAGGVVWRRGAGGIEVLIVHRARYDDWSLPKGKAEPDETWEQCALREVEEETGLRCRLGPDVGSVSYVDGNGRPKRVRYWSMTMIGGRFTVNDEVDDVRWLPAEEAAEPLTYERDAGVVRSFRALPR